MYTDSNTPSELIFKFILDNLKHVEDREEKIVICQAGCYLLQDKTLAGILKEISKSMPDLVNGQTDFSEERTAGVREGARHVD